MGLLKLYCVSDTKTLVKHDRGAEGFAINFLTAGDQQTIDFMLLTQNVGGGFAAPWTRLAVGTYQLKIGLFLTSSRAQLSFQDTWADDGIGNVKSGALSLNTAEITAALTGPPAVTELACLLEVEIVDGSGFAFTAYRQALTLYKPLITPGAAVPAAPEVAATQSWVKGLYVPKEQGAGDVSIWRSPSGQRFLVHIDDNGQFHADPIPG